MKPFLTITCFFILIQSANSQAKQDVLCYIEKYKAIALEEMVRCKIPASVTLAQGLHESSYGKSKLSTEANNHFGIKCKGEWDGKKFFMNDDEPNECFRVYDQAEDSYADHSDFLVTRTRYAGLFDLPITDYKAWAHGLKAAGYATNPKYAEILIKTIEDYNLTQFDNMGLAMIAEKERLMAPPSDVSQPVFANIKTQRQSTSNTTSNTIVITMDPPVAQKEKLPKPVTIATVFAPATSAANQKEYIVNGCKAIKAQGIVDPLTVAFNYQIQYEQVLALNDMNEGDRFKDGENIFLQSKKARGADATYVVQAGENMHDISQRSGVKLRDLYQKNQMALNDQPVAGESLSLLEKRATAPRTMTYSEYLKSLNTNSTKATTTESTNSPTIKKADVQYTVGPSDTLYSIAKRFNTSVQQLCVLNNLQSADLQPGQTLVIGK